jgi:hypothetical protein
LPSLDPSTKLVEQQGGVPTFLGSVPRLFLANMLQVSLKICKR